MATLEELTARRDEVLARRERLAALLPATPDEQARRRWQVEARPEQRLPDGDWRAWYLQGGRGSGKTRAAAEGLAELIRSHPPGDWAVIAPTYGDARDTCMEGGSGLLAALGLTRSFSGWNRSMGELRLPNGGTVFVDGADDGALRVQGKNLRGAWADEVGLWRRWPTAWHESIGFAVRLAPAKVIASGTPKEGHGLVLLLVEDERVPKSRLRTTDNLANLSSHAVADLERRWAGTRLGRQELEGEVLTDVPGALWTRALLEACRVEVAPDCSRIVVAVDPSGGDSEEHDEQGIVVCGRGYDGHGYLLADRSCRETPNGWGRRAVQAWSDFDADAIVWEANYGGQMAEHTLRTAADAIGLSGVTLRQVTASRGKRVRAEPIAALYEQSRIHHAGSGFELLEDQMVSWTPESGRSPDRLDALVWAFSDLMLGRHADLGAVGQAFRANDDFRRDSPWAIR